jgi:Domain of unknown function (DUF4157)
MLQAPISDRTTKADASAKTAEPLPGQELALPLLAGLGQVRQFQPLQQRNNLAGLQKAYGNQAVLRMMRGQEQTSPIANPVPGGILQRKCACGNSAGATGTCAECQEKQGLALQTKLRISEPGDVYEQEADRIADQIMQMPNPSPQRQVEPEEENEEIVQRKATPKPTPLNSDQSPSEIPPIVHEVLNSPGQPLDSETRTFMESRLGHDFSQVRVHTNAKAEESARRIDSQAYTVRQEIIFGSGYYAPKTNEGRKLLAHELTHVIQQSNKPTWLARQVHRSAQDVDQAVPESYLERLLIAIGASGPEIINGLIIGMAVILGLSLLVTLFTTFFPEITASIVAVISTTTIAGASLATWLASLGLSYALSELAMAYVALHFVITSPNPTRAELEQAGCTWGRRTGEALAIFIPALLHLPARIADFLRRSISISSIRSPLTSSPRSSSSTGTSEPLQRPNPLSEPGSAEDIDALIRRLETEGETGGFQASSPPVQVPVRRSGEAAQVLEVGAGRRVTSLGLPPEEELLQVTRTDIQGQRGGIIAPDGSLHYLDASQPIPPEFVGHYDTLIINNPREYRVDIAELGRSLRPGGRIIVQGRGRVPSIPRSQQQWNRDFQRLIEETLPPNGSPPPGYRRVLEGEILPEQRLEDPSRIMGGPFQRTTGEEIPTDRINARLIFERLVD